MIHVNGHLPGFVRYLAAPLREDGCDSVNNRQPVIRHLVRVLTFLAELSSVNRSTQSSARYPTTLEPGGKIRTYDPIFSPLACRTPRSISMKLCSYRILELLTGLLNISLLEGAARPPLIAGCLERRAATPLTLSLSVKRAICVSVVACTSRAVGGTMARCYVESRRSRRSRQFELFMNMGMWKGRLGSEWNVGRERRKEDDSSID